IYLSILNKITFLPVAALLLLLSVHTLAEVVKSMSDCSQFFLDQTPPHVPGVLEDGKILNQNRYKPICQTYKNQRRFVTLYDTKNKIPVFSTKAAGKNMKRVNKNREYNHQAGSIDYQSNKTFDKGHIFPSSYASTLDDKKSTFTLTNIVPQAESFNKGSWNNMEKCIKCVMEKYCINSNGDTEGFVMTGAQPSSGSFLNNRVNVPSALWSAFCCYSANMEAWIASAHWGDNVQDEFKNKFLETITLEALYQKLSISNSGNCVCF
uniref:Uncharacterized protein n=1 Tax=Fundulus heteroclitus TaxID=8078 RepID=A0A3Q2UR37_FUNHE